MYKKYIIFTIGIILLGSMVAGGTYAYLSRTVTVTSGSANLSTHCFLIDYNINNQDNSQDISGILFPSANASGGLGGRVGLKTNSACTLQGTGTLKLHFTSGEVGSNASGHCENATTLETLKDYTTSSACSGHGSWVTNGTPLKYAVYNNSSLTSPLRVGYIRSTDIGNDITVYDNFTITSTESYYYVYIWLDGYISGDDYTDINFAGYVSASATQTE